MASLMIHLIVAEKYCKLNNIENKDEIIAGSIAPDVLPNKDNCHYVSWNKKPEFYKDAIMNRVDLFKFCRVNALVTEYTKGYFLHLLTDYIFYRQYLVKLPKFKGLDSKEYELEFVRDYMYYEYDRLAKYLSEQYSDVNMEILPPVARHILNEPMKVFDIESIEKVMDYCASLDLEKLYKELKCKKYSSIKFKL